MTREFKISDSDFDQKNPLYMVMHPLFLIFLYLMLSLNFSNGNSSFKIYTRLFNVFFTLPCYNVYILFHKLKHEKKPHLHVGRIRWCSWSCCEPRSNSCSAHTSGSSPGPKKILGQTTTYIHLYFTTKT